MATTSTSTPPPLPRLTDGDRLLAGILADPADDAIRLIYADWLEETGDEARGEFIRVQIELEGVRDKRCVGFSWHSEGCSDRAACNRAMRLQEREGELYRALGGPHGLRTELGEGIQRWRYSPNLNEFTRGFQSRFSMTLNEWLAHGHAIQAAHPVQVVTASDSEPKGGDSAGWFGWRVRPPITMSLHQSTLDALIPDGVFDLLGGKLSSHGTWRDFESRDLANAALSAALLEHAKTPPATK